MQFKINTTKLNSLLSKAQKGVGNSKIMTITEYLKIELQNKVLSITATDMSNFITVKANDIEGTDGTAIVKADALIKLASKTTKQDMTFTLAESHVEVKGNGTYKIPTLEDAEFPSFEFNSSTSKTDIEVSKMKRAFQVNRSSIANEMLMPCLTGFNVGEKVVTTDGVKMCINNNSIFSQNILITQTLADLLASLTANTVSIQKDKNKLLFTTDNIIIFGTELDGVEEYPDIMPILDITHDGTVTVQKADLLNALDRLSIFVNPIDNNGVTLTFKTTTLVIEDLKKNSTEELQLEQHLGEEEVSLAVNLDYLKDLISVLSNSSVEIQYGNDLPLKIVEEGVTQILSTMSVE